MEKEIGRIERKLARANLKVPLFISLGLIGAGLLTFFITMMVYIFTPNLGRSIGMFFYYCWPGLGVMILGTVLSGIFFLLTFLPEKKITLVLTNKRIYYSTCTKRFFSRAEDSFTKSYNLNKITHYNASERKILKHIPAFFRVIFNLQPFTSLCISTEFTRASFYVDEDFYNKFVEAINATIYNEQ